MRRNQKEVCNFQYNVWLRSIGSGVITSPLSLGPRQTFQILAQVKVADEAVKNAGHSIVCCLQSAGEQRLHLECEVVSA